MRDFVRRFFARGGLAAATVLLLIGISGYRSQAALADSPTFFVTATGLVELGSAAPVWYATKLTVATTTPMTDPAAGSAGFILVVDGTVAVSDTKSKQTTLLAEQSSMFVAPDAKSSLAAVDGDATIWRIAVVAEGADSPVAQGAGVPQPLTTISEGIANAPKGALRQIDLRMGVVGPDTIANLGFGGFDVPLVVLLSGEAAFFDGSAAVEGQFAAPPPNNVNPGTLISTDTATATIGYITIGPALDPDSFGASGTQASANASRAVPTVKSGGATTQNSDSDTSVTATATTSTTPDTDGVIDVEEVQLHVTARSWLTTRRRA